MTMTSEQAEKLASEWEGYARMLSPLDLVQLAAAVRDGSPSCSERVAMAYLLCARDIREAR